MTYVAPIPPHAGVTPCNGPDVDPEIFFPDKGNRLVDYHEARAAAVAACARCPVASRKACRNYAVENDVKGIWAGTTYDQRQKFRTERGITARPVVAYPVAVDAHKAGRTEDRRAAA